MLLSIAVDKLLKGTAQRAKSSMNSPNIAGGNCVLSEFSGGVMEVHLIDGNLRALQGILFTPSPSAKDSEGREVAAVRRRPRFTLEHDAGR